MSGLFLLIAVLQAPISSQELAEYRLTRPVFDRFVQASRLVAAASRDDPRLADRPLFSREVSVLGEAAAEAAALETRLTNEPGLATALRLSGISAREYTKFAIGLFAARLAHGFVKSGVMRRVPPGVATDNVAFIDAHETDVAAVLRDLGVEE